jgi:hypothetical protein
MDLHRIVVMQRIEDKIKVSVAKVNGAESICSQSP